MIQYVEPNELPYLREEELAEKGEVDDYDESDFWRDCENERLNEEERC